MQTIDIHEVKMRIANDLSKQLVNHNANSRESKLFTPLSFIETK